MSGLSTNGKRLFIARHGETIYNLAGRIQGNEAYTPLTLTGFAQADEMGRALVRHLSATKSVRAEPVEAPVREPSLLRQAQDERFELDLVASDTDRALQTLSIISQHIGVDWHQAKPDIRLGEIDMGEWTGIYYRDLDGKLDIDSTELLFATTAPGGETYPDIAVRLRDWLSEQKFERDMILISHGMTSRVLRGVLTGLPENKRFQAPIAQSLPQGSVVQICDGVEDVIHRGGGEGEKA